MDRYKKLASNTIVLAIGQFSSKVLSYILIILYTRAEWLETADMSSATNITNTANLLMSIVTISIGEAVIRFGLEKKINGTQVFSIGVFTAIFGFLVLAPFMPLISRLMNQLNGSSGNGVLIYIFIITSSLRTICGFYVRSRGNVKLYALDGIITTFTLLIFGVIFMGVFKLKAVGYIISIIASDFLSIVFLFYMANLHKRLIVVGIDKELRRSMIKYSLPLTPSLVAWWLATSANGYFVTNMISREANGLYSAASKLPGIIVIISGIVSQAWQMSAVTERNSRTVANFYTNVFNIYQGVVYVVASGMLLFNKQLTGFFGSNYSDAYKYTPFIIVGVMFSCFSTFLNSIYLADKKSGKSFLTAFIGSMLNIILSYVLVPIIGVYGATIGSMVNFGVVFLIRAIDTQKIVLITYNKLKIGLNIGFIFIMALLIIFEKPYSFIIRAVLFVLIVAMNFKTCMAGVMKVISKKR